MEISLSRDYIFFSLFHFIREKKAIFFLNDVFSSAEITLRLFGDFKVYWEHLDDVL